MLLKLFQAIFDYGFIKDQGLIYRISNEFESITLGDFIEKWCEVLIENDSSWKSTFFTEFETINIGLKLIDLLTNLHENGIVHANLNPFEVFINDLSNPTQFWFYSLFNCIWQPRDLRYQDTELDLNAFDCRLRNSQYLSPEENFLGGEFEKIMKATDLNAKDAR